MQLVKRVALLMVTEIIGKGMKGKILTIEEVSWGTRRWEAAVAAMQGLLAHKETLDRWTVEDIADYSFRLADALVKKFKEEGERR